MPHRGAGPGVHRVEEGRRGRLTVRKRRSQPADPADLQRGAGELRDVPVLRDEGQPRGRSQGGTQARRSVQGHRRGSG